MNEQELLQISQNFEHKLLELKEREAVKDFELNKLTKELELLRLEYMQYKLRNDQH